MVLSTKERSMNKLLLGTIFAGLFLTASPASAQHWDHRSGVDHGGRQHPGSYREIQWQRHHHHHHHRHGRLNTTEKIIIGAVIGGVVVDAIHRNRTVEPVVVTPIPDCYYLRKQDNFGNIYYERICR